MFFPNDFRKVKEEESLLSLGDHSKGLTSKNTVSTTHENKIELLKKVTQNPVVNQPYKSFNSLGKSIGPTPTSRENAVGSNSQIKKMVESIKLKIIEKLDVSIIETLKEMSFQEEKLNHSIGNEGLDCGLDEAFLGDLSGLLNKTKENEEIEEIIAFLN
jgi:hypothetical protein